MESLATGSPDFFAAFSLRMRSKRKDRFCQGNVNMVASIWWEALTTKSNYDVYLYPGLECSTRIAIAKKADRTVYAIVLCTPYRIAAEPNRRKCRVWNSHGHVTTLPMAIPGAKISAVRVFIVLWQNDTSHSNCG